MLAKLAPLAVVLLLAACGADAPPEAPTRDSVEPGVTFSGDARFGVVTTL